MAARHAIKKILVYLVGIEMCACTVVCMYMVACTLNFVDLRYVRYNKNCSYLVIK